MKTKQIIITIVVVVLIGIASFFGYKYFVENKNPQTTVNEVTDQVTNQVNGYKDAVVGFAKQASELSFDDAATYTKDQVDQAVNQLTEIKTNLESKANEIANSALPENIKIQFATGIQTVIDWINDQLQKFGNLLPNL